MRFVAAMLLFLCPSAASAGLKATYIESGQQIVIEVANGGDARIGGPDPNSYGIVKGGEFFLVGKENGAWRVARMEDVATAMSGVLPTFLKDLFGSVGSAVTKPANLRVEEKGKRTHLGREGLLLAVRDLDEGTAAKTQLFLVSRDEDLKPVGRALEQFSYSFFLLVGGLTGPVAPASLNKISSLFALGTPLEIEGGYKLVALENTAVNPARVALPAPPQTLAEIKAGIKVQPVEADEAK